MRSLILAPMYAVFVSVLLQRAGFQGGLFLFSLVIGFVLMIFHGPAEVLGQKT